MEMRRDEEFVLNALATAYAASWKPGQDPPDGYLILPSQTIAVEVSTLTQHVFDGSSARPRLSDDAPAIRLANELDDELSKSIPANRNVMLLLSSPIAELRKTKAALSPLIVSLVAQSSRGRVRQKVNIRGNKIEVYVDESDGAERKKVVAAIMNRFSDSRIEKNTTYILEERIADKATKCSRISFDGAIWLALLNDYFLTDIDTYRHAMKTISVEHPFERVLVVSVNGTVETLIQR
jgi:hypothetical protein